MLEVIDLSRFRRPTCACKFREEGSESAQNDKPTDNQRFSCAGVVVVAVTGFVGVLVFYSALYSGALNSQSIVVVVKLFHTVTVIEWPL